MKIAIIAKIEKIHRNTTGLITEITFTNGTELALIPTDMLELMPARLNSEHFDRVFIDSLAPEEVKHKAAYAIMPKNDEEEEGTVETL